MPNKTTKENLPTAHLRLTEEQRKTQARRTMSRTADFMFVSNGRNEWSWSLLSRLKDFSSLWVSLSDSGTPWASPFYTLTVAQMCLPKNLEKKRKKLFLLFHFLSNLSVRFLLKREELPLPSLSSCADGNPSLTVKQAEWPQTAPGFHAAAETPVEQEPMFK